MIGLANAWDLSSSGLVAAAGEDPADPLRVTAHRAAVIEAVRRLGHAS